MVNPHRGSNDRLGDIRQDDALYEIAGEQQNDRRDIEAAQIRHRIPDRSEQWLGDGIQGLPDGANHRVVGVDDAKRHQPGEDHNGDDDIGVQRDEVADETKKFEHCESEFACRGAM